MSLKSLIATGTKLWLDSIDPQEVRKNYELGASGATSNPIIVSDILKTGAFDDRIAKLTDKGLKDEQIAWEMTDYLVREAQSVFQPVWDKTKGNNGYVSFELDPLLEDVTGALPHAQRVKQYIELGKKWAAGHKNRMIKVPATPAGLDALEELAAAGITLNVTLCFSERQYITARDAIWKGAQRRKDGLSGFKSVYSIFVSRVDVYTEKQVPDLSSQAQGLVGIVNAKKIYLMNRDFWQDKKLPLQQELIFVSTGTKKPTDPPDKYVEAFASDGIETNPPATNDAVQKLNKTYTPQVDKLLLKEIVDEIAQKVAQQKMEDVLMEEGLKKFADPQKALLKLIGEKRAALAAAK